METQERRKRNPAIEKKFSDIKREDIRVAVIGTVVELDSSINAVTIDDGHSTLKAMLPDEQFEKCEPGKLIRVVGLVAPALAGDEIELRGELVQDFSRLDKSLYAEYLKA